MFILWCVVIKFFFPFPQAMGLIQLLLAKVSDAHS